MHRTNLVRGIRRRGLLFALIASFAVLLIAAGCEEDDDLLQGVTPTPAQPAPATPTPTPEPTPPPVAAPAEPRVALELIADGLDAPVDLAAPDDGSGRLFVVEQRGTIRVIAADGQLVDEPFLDLSDRMVTLQEGFDERGVLGLALHPDFSNNGRFVVYYSAPLRDGAPSGWDHTSHVSEFTVSADDENRADPDSERVILQVDQPQFNHNAGHIRFGLDGYLYVPLGDGGGANDVGEGHTPDIGNGQDRTNLLGSVLRIDIDDEGDAERAYGIPQDNPFVDEDEAQPEIWVYGLRNPFDISFDPDGEYGLLIADAGQDLFEWVNMAQGGENFGWFFKEGSHCFDPDNPTQVPDDCPDEGPWGERLVDPVVEYAREDFGVVIVGAHIYRGNALEGFQGMMIFPDWLVGESGAIFLAEPNGPEGSWEHRPIEIVTDFDGYITTLGRDAENELYILANQEAGPVPGQGALYRLVRAEGNGGAGS